MVNEIKTYSIEQLESIAREFDQPKFRAKQLFNWLHAHQAFSYDEMSNLPSSFRTALAAAYPLSASHVADKQVSKDGTRKYILSLFDGAQVETVGMPTDEDNPQQRKRLTVCFSTQVGCAMGCSFCATGEEGFTRNLIADEMVSQITTVQKDFQRPVTNVVAMGQGEPFLNYDELIKALRIINGADDLNIGARKITVSTCGIIDGIKRFREEPEQFTLAVSLHSALQEKRDMMMPRVKHQPLRKLKKSLSSYVDETNRRVTLEYLLIDGVNDQKEDLDALIGFCEGLLCHVNLLPANETSDSIYKPSPQSISNLWIRKLGEASIETTLRKSRGSDIAGACGQLKNSFSR